MTTQNNNTQPPSPAPGQQPNTQVTHVAAPQPSQSDRFTKAVMNEFSTAAGKVEVTSFQKKLIQNYFIKLDMTLKDNEVKRLAKNEQYRDPLEFSWTNVNMRQLALDVISFSSIGLDPLQPNHINMIPYKNGKTNLFDIGFIIGYDGIELKARKYGYEKPDDVVIKIVKANDTFKPIWKDKNNNIETYIFESANAFDRGEIVGGFYYHAFYNTPQKNKLVPFSLADIEKRKPKYASAEFWGGEKDVWKDGKKAGKETVEGWFEEMCFKTIKRAAYNAIPIDSEKIDEHLVKMLQTPDEATHRQIDEKVSHEIKENANKKELNIDAGNPNANMQYAEEVKEPAISVAASSNQTNTNTAQAGQSSGSQLTADF